MMAAIMLHFVGIWTLIFCPQHNLRIANYCNFPKIWHATTKLSYGRGTGHRNTDKAMPTFQHPFFQSNAKFYHILLLQMHFHFYMLKSHETLNTTLMQISRLISSHRMVYCIAMVTRYQLEVSPYNVCIGLPFNVSLVQ